MFLIKEKRKRSIHALALFRCIPGVKLDLVEIKVDDD